LVSSEAVLVIELLPSPPPHAPTPAAISPIIAVAQMSRRPVPGDIGGQRSDRLK
jgi:hypothetical protein